MWSERDLSDLRVALNERRARILVLIANGTNSCAGLVDDLGISRPAVLSHLDRLTGTGFVCASKVMDRRSRRLKNRYELTERGRRLLQQIAASLEKPSVTNARATDGERKIRD